MAAPDEKHLDLLLHVGDMAAVLAGSSDVQEFLDSTVKKVAEHMKADVCSIYLYDESSRKLVLRATVGLSPEAVGKVELAPGEGLVGMALKELRPIVEEEASTNPNFRYFENTAEDPFEVFLAVPILKGIERIGVIVVQRREGPFKEHDTSAMRVLGAQLAGAIENAKSMLLPPGAEGPDDPLAALGPVCRGRPVCAGHAVGACSVMGETHLLAMIRGGNLAEIQGDADETQLRAAVERTESQLSSLQERFEAILPEMASLIFSAHLLMLKDSSFTGKMLELVCGGETGQRAVVSVAREFINIFSRSSMDYMKEKVNDVEDLALRLLQNLEEHQGEVDSLESGIVIARELFPLDMLKLACGKVAAIVLTSGGITSHVAILARSLQLPMIIVNEPLLLDLHDGVRVAVDGYVGNLYIDPDESVLAQFQQREELEQRSEQSRGKVAEKTVTGDGTRIQLMANINLLSELPLAHDLKAEGIGLYRTEFPFLVNTTFPSQEQQRRVYEKLFDSMPEKEITVRTLDVGGDKVLAYYDHAGEENPALGLRSIRFSFKHPDILRDQVSALLLAAGKRPLRLMFPMVASVDDFLNASAVVDNCCDALQDKGEECMLPVKGMMIELPSVLEIIDDLAREADFFSIGTNDFVQYMLAVDRTNERVAELYDPWHPSVLRAINRVVEAAAKQGTDVSVCGEMAHDMPAVRFLVGIGVRKLSVDPHFIPEIQQALQATSLEDCEDFAARVLSEPSIQGVHRILEA